MPTSKNKCANQKNVFDRNFWSTTFFGVKERSRSINYILSIGSTKWLGPTNEVLSIHSHHHPTQENTLSINSTSSLLISTVTVLPLLFTNYINKSLIALYLYFSCSVLQYFYKAALCSFFTSAKKLPFELFITHRHLPPLALPPLTLPQLALPANYRQYYFI